MTTMTELRLGETERKATNEAIQSLQERDVTARIWRRDPTAFTANAAHRASIENRLGWLTSPGLMSEHAAELKAFAESVRADGYTKVLLLGMGGSSLCPEVLAKTFAGTTQGLELRILDSTDPAAVLDATSWATLGETLFIVASKSGGTIEVRSFAAHFWGLAVERFGQDAGKHFLAITDPGSPLGELATKNGYRKVFENPADIGGRFSAISFFGLVPAALIGIDVEAFAARASKMAAACGESVPAGENPAAVLGAALGALAKLGRDKMTLVPSPKLSSLGSWVEQLVAESTGKDGKGVVPVDLEPLGAPESYGSDRVFVHVRHAGSQAETELVDQLAAAGHPVITLNVPSLLDLGGELFRWEYATAIAGAILDVNPFDEPNVTEAKQATKTLLGRYEQERTVERPSTAAQPMDEVVSCIKRAKPGGYVVFSAFLQQTPERDTAFEKIRSVLRARTKLASTLGYGPRFLHSTGQLHKGGTPSGVFVVLTAGVDKDVPIPGDPYTFEVLRDAQALGDVEVLDAHDLPRVRIDLGKDVEGGLAKLATALEQL